MAVTLLKHALRGQIATAARQNGNGSFSYDFFRSYDLQGVVFSIGDTKIGGIFSGFNLERSGMLTISGDIDFYLEDAFADPLDIGIEVIAGKPYPITDSWFGHLEGRVYADASRSVFVGNCT